MRLNGLFCGCGGCIECSWLPNCCSWSLTVRSSTTCVFSSSTGIDCASGACTAGAMLALVISTQSASGATGSAPSGMLMIDRMLDTSLSWSLCWGAAYPSFDSSSSPPPSLSPSSLSASSISSFSKAHGEDAGPPTLPAACSAVSERPSSVGIF